MSPCGDVTQVSKILQLERTQYNFLELDTKA